MEQPSTTETIDSPVSQEADSVVELPRSKPGPKAKPKYDDDKFNALVETVASMKEVMDHQTNAIAKQQEFIVGQQEAIDSILEGLVEAEQEASIAEGLDVEPADNTVERLTALVLRIAHQTGTSRSIIIGNGFANFEPQKQDMHRTN